MSYTINKVLKVFKFNCIRNIYTFFPANGYLNVDWTGGTYPKYTDERIVAAKKYNIHLKEYKSYCDDEYSYGDYPKLAFKGIALKDFHYPYDIPEHRRNFNEPIHIEIDLIGEDKYDAGIKEHIFYPSKVLIAFFVFVFSSLYGSCYIFSDFISFQAVTEKQYPWNNKVHYTFENFN